MWLRLNKTEYYLIRITSYGYILSKFTKIINNFADGILTEDKTFQEKTVKSIDELIKIKELKPLVYSVKNYFCLCFI